MIAQTRRARLMLFTVVLTFAGGYFLVSLTLPIIGIFILAYLLFTKASFFYTIKGCDFEPERTLSSATGYVNVPFSVELCLTNTCRDNVVVSVSDDVSSELSVIEGAHSMQAHCNPFEEIHLSYALATSHRGVCEFTKADIVVTDKRGLFYSSFSVDLDSSIYIEESPARLERAEKIARTAAQGKESDSKILHLEGEDYEGIREYIPGDRPSRIDWKSSSRALSLLTKLFETDDSTRYYIVLDVSSSMRKRVGDASKLHHSVLLTMQLAKVFLNQGVDVGFVAFEEYSVTGHVAPSDDKLQYGRILDVLSDLPGVVNSRGYSPSFEAEDSSDEHTRSFFSAIMPFISKTRRGFVSAVASSGVYETIREIVDRGPPLQHLLVISDVETNMSALLSALKHASSRGVKVTLLSPYSPYFGISLHELSVEEAERLYGSYLLRSQRLHSLKGYGVHVIEETPEDSIDMLYPRIARRSKA